MFAAVILTGCTPDPDEAGLWEKSLRFFSLRDPFVRSSLAAAVLLGVNCGLLGGYLVVRRMALAGDTLAHAVLPGIVAGYLYHMTKDPLAMLAGAAVAGIVGSLLVSGITHTTKLKSDAAQGLVLTVFFALGVCWIAMLPPGNKTGLDKFIFGQLAAVDSQDVSWLAWSLLATLASVLLLHRGFLVLSFDAAFGRVAGLPVRFLHYLLMLLTTVAIVVSMEAVGVVLVSALLVIPAAAAGLLTDQLHRLLVISAAIGVLSALAGSYFSFVGTRLPAGPMVVLCAAALFAGAFCFSPRHGWLTRWWKARQWNRRVRLENALKAIYHLLEKRDSAEIPGRHFTADEFAASQGCTVRRSSSALKPLQQAGWLAAAAPGDFSLTDAGWAEARRVVRNHRLWELYLTQRARFATDHVHEDAEKMEHLLSEENVRRMAEQLGNPTADPHGRPIPPA